MKLSQTFAKKSLAVSASLALALGGALAFTGSAQAVDATGTTLTFEADDTIGAAASAFEGGTSEIADSPAGHAGKVFKFTKTGQDWSGANLVLPDNNLRVTTGDLPVVTMDIWSGAASATPVMFKLQSAGGWPGSHNCLKAVEVQPGWNFVSYDMSTAKCIDTDNGWAGESYQTGVSYIVAAIFPNFGADDTTYTGAAKLPNDGQVYLIDNIKFNSAASSAPTAKVTGPSKKVLRVDVNNAEGKKVSIKVQGVRTWTSSTTFTAGEKTIKLTVPSGTYKVTVTVGHSVFKKTQVVK